MATRFAELGIGLHRLSPPRLATNVIPRSRLLDMLESTTARVITVTAGAGYGKSTLLSAWTRSSPRPCAWLQIEPSDNDPVRLLRSISCSMQAALPARSLLGIARETQPASLDRTLALIEAELVTTGPFIVVMDDVHLITDEAAAGVLDGLLDALPVQCQVVLSGRSDPPVRTARRMLSGDLTAIRANDLLFTDDEAMNVLEGAAEFAGVEERSAIAQRVGGWPAGTQFVLLALRSSSGDSPSAPNIQEGSAELLAAFFQQEFLRALPPHDREFLLRTAVLDHLSGDLCDFVLERSESAEHLEALVRSGNAFVIPAGTTGVFRYHPLFADVLLDELRTSLPDHEAALRHRAIEWFDARDKHTAVVEQALASGGLIDPSPWIFRYIVAMIASAHVATLGRWLQSFTPRELRTNTLLSLASAWHALYANQLEEMEHWIATTASLSYDGSLPDGTTDLATAVAALRMMAGTGGVLQTAANARTVRDAGAGPWIGVAVLLEAVAVQLAGGATDVRAMFERAEFETRGLPTAHAVALAHLALDSMRRNDDRASDEIRTALDEVDRYGLTQFHHVTVVYCVKSLADARAGRHEASLQASTHAETLIADVTDLVERAQIHFRLILADAAIARDDWTTARRFVREAESRLPLEPDAVLLHEWTGRTAARCADQGTRAPQVDLTPAERRVLDQLASHYTLGEIADHLYVSRNTVKTHTVSIYRKLVVSGRSEAVARASELGLLDGGVDERPVITGR